MNFVIPKTKNMKTLNNLIKKFYEEDFLSFVNELGQRVFHFYTEGSVYAFVFMVEENKFDVFRGEEGLFTLHFLLSADDRNIRTYGLSSFTVEPKLEDDIVNGLSLYKEKFPHYINEDGLYVLCNSNKPGQKPCVLDEEETLFMISAMEKLFLIKKEYDKKKLVKPNYLDTEAVCIYEFEGKKFKTTYAPLEDYEFLPDINVNRYNDIPLCIDYRDLVIKPGTLYIGQIHGFLTYESYSTIAPFEVDLTPIILYSIDEEGEIIDYLYSSPFVNSEIILAAMISRYINEYGIYDTIVTDNYLLHLLFKRIDIDGVEVKFEPANDQISFITKYMIKTNTASKDVEEFVSLVLETKEDVREIFVNNYDNLYEVIENIFDESFVEEEIDDEDDDFFSLDNESEYVS